MKKIIVLLTLSFNAFAINNFVYPWVMKSNDTVTVTRWKGNNDTVQAWAGRVCDTLNRGVVHFSQSSLTHDSTVKYVRIDTIRSNPNIDSIAGNVVITGSPVVSGTVTSGGFIGNVTGNATTVTNGVYTNGSYSNPSWLTLLASSKITGKVDSATSLRGGTVNASTGTFSGACTTLTLNTGNGNNELYPMDQAVLTTSNVTHNRLSIADSIYSPAIRSLRLSGSYISAGSLGATSGNFSGACTTATLNTGNGNYELYNMNQDVTTTSNVIHNRLYVADSLYSPAIRSLRLSGSYISAGSLGATSGNFSGACTTATINTGLGNFEVGQNLQITDDVTFDSVYATDDIIIEDTLKVGTTSSGQVKLFDGWYKDTTFVCSLYTNSNTQLLTTGNVRAIKIGNQATLAFTYVTGTVVGPGTLGVTIRNVPSFLRSSISEQTFPVSFYEATASDYITGYFHAVNSSPNFYFSTGTQGSPGVGSFILNRPVVCYLIK